MADKKPRFIMEREVYHHVAAGNLEKMFDAEALPDRDVAERTICEISIKNWIWAKTITNQTAYKNRQSMKEIAVSAKKLRDVDKDERFAIMLDEMARAKLIPVDLKKTSLEAPIDKKLEKKYQ